MRLFDDNNLVTLHIVFIDPDSEPLEVMGPERGQHDHATWLVYNAMHEPKGIQAVVPVAEVRANMLDLLDTEYEDKDLIADTYIRSAIMRPDSPFGLGIRLHNRDDLHVVFRGECYWRHERGALTPDPDCTCGQSLSWPTEQAWHLAQEIIYAWAAAVSMWEEPEWFKAEREARDRLGPTDRINKSKRWQG